MQPVHPLHQIFYSADTRAALDPGFIPLDNLANPRPDWREYWPMRRYLQETPLEDQHYYGFFSPKFGQKTGLAAAHCHALLAQLPATTDVVLLSPFFDQSAFYLNIFEQAISHHHGLLPVFQAAVAHIAPGVRLEALVTDQTNTVFSNFFIARPRFWREWLRLNEILFAEAEANASPLGQGLNSVARYALGEVQAKVFMMERVASLMLATQSGWNVIVRDPTEAPPEPLFATWQAELVRMDALKSRYRETGDVAALQTFRQLQRAIAQQSRERAGL